MVHSGRQKVYFCIWVFPLYQALHFLMETWNLVVFMVAQANHLYSSPLLCMSDQRYQFIIPVCHPVGTRDGFLRTIFTVLTLWMQMLDPVLGIHRILSHLKYRKSLSNYSGVACEGDTEQHPQKKIKLSTSISIPPHASPASSVSAEVCFPIHSLIVFRFPLFSYYLVVNSVALPICGWFKLVW